jgi:hypothetical protein
VEIDHAENALVLLLHPDPIPDRPQVIAEVKRVGRLDAGENAAFHGGIPGWDQVAVGRPYRRGALISQDICPFSKRICVCQVADILPRD